MDISVCGVAMIWSVLSILIFCALGVAARLILSGRIGVIIELLKMTARATGGTGGPSVEEHNKHFTVNFTLGCRKYKLMIPKVRRVSGKEIYIHWPDGTKEYIGHPPGVPFLVSPGMIGADKIEV